MGRVLSTRGVDSTVTWSLSSGIRVQCLVSRCPDSQPSRKVPGTHEKTESQNTSFWEHTQGDQRVPVTSFRVCSDGVTATEKDYSPGLQDTGVSDPNGGLGGRRWGRCRRGRRGFRPVRPVHAPPHHRRYLLFGWGNRTPPPDPDEDSQAEAGRGTVGRSDHSR